MVPTLRSRCKTAIPAGARPERDSPPRRTATKFEVKYGPAYALGVIGLDGGEQVQAVTGAMVSMSAGITIETGMKGGLMAGLKRSVLGGESFFVKTFTASQPGEVTVSPPLPGDMIATELSEKDLLVHSGSFLAANSEVQIDTKWGGAKTFFSGEGLFLVKLSGHGTVMVSSYGAIVDRELADGESWRSTPRTSSASSPQSATTSASRAAGRRRCSAARASSSS